MKYKIGDKVRIDRADDPLHNHTGTIINRRFRKYEEAVAYQISKHSGSCHNLWFYEQHLRPAEPWLVRYTPYVAAVVGIGTLVLIAVLNLGSR